MHLDKLPPPTQFTWGDKYRLFLGVLALLLGIVILVRTLMLAVSPPAIMVGLAFIGFGAFRLWLGLARLRQWRQNKNPKQ